MTATALIYRMVIAAIAGKPDRIAELYEAYAREQRLHVTVAEILQNKIVAGKRQQGETGFFAPKGRHSEKPEKMRQMIERVSYEPRIELFARQTTPGWDAWGNEIQTEGNAAT